MLRKIYFSIVTLLLVGTAAIAQNTGGAIKVLLKDKTNGETIPFANVVAYQNGVQVGVGTTDMDGYAMIKPLAPGKYDVKGVYVGYQAAEVKGVIVGDAKTAYITIELSNGEGVKLDEVVVVDYQEPLIDPDVKSGSTVTREEYQNMATKNINSVAATSAGVFQADEGGDINVRGGRSNATTYFVDGVKVIGSLGVPQQGVEQLSVITGGLPAQYGDATSGVISVTTRGPQSQFFGGVELISSQLTDKYGYNSLGFSVGGPIYQKKDSAGNKTPVVGFILSGQGTYEKDPDPSFVKIYHVKDDVLRDLEKTPLLKQVSANGNESFYPRLLNVGKEDMVQSAFRPNAASRSIQLNGKLDFKLAANTNLTLGGAFDYSNLNDFIFNYSLFNSKNNSQYTGMTWRTFANIRQKFGNQSADKEKTQALVTNAYFTFLVSYEKTKATRQDAQHKDSYFRYGNQGKYHFDYLTADKTNTAYYRPSLVYNPNTNSLDTLEMVFNGPSDSNSQIVFEKADYNPETANYSSQIFAESSDPIYNVLDTRLSNGFINGARPTSINSLWAATGRKYNGYQVTDNTQIRFATNFSADIKNHAIMAGVEYDQRDLRGYNVYPIGLWTRMRLIANSHILAESVRDSFYVNGLKYVYNSDGINTAVQSQFSKSIREKLGMDPNSTTKINTDALSPDDLTLDMFSAGDLLNNNVDPLVDYWGYDYLGNKDNAKTSFERFEQNKDSKGNNLYSVGGYKPIYVAGYIQDKFDYKDIKFNVGVRVDRFDANQKRLKDPYSFHETYTAGEKAPDRPSNIGEDYVVYVDALGSEKVVGYRSTDEKSGITTWYNSEGKEISDPAALTTGGRVYPWLKDVNFAQQNSFSSKAFQDYVPQINVMPRVAFSFPISDVANFFAHYDVLTQRPTAAMRFDPKEYFYYSSNSSNPFITNSNLKPEKTIDYEIGYNQVLNEKKNAALKLTAFYREMRNQITTQTIVQAYPSTYYTYVNRDFGTVKGLTAEFQLRRTNGVQLDVNYTLQFADGSGSNANSGANLASSGQPNLRVTLPLDYDQRHNFVVTLDYRFGQGKDYKGPQYNKTKKDGSSQTVQIFKDMGANIQFLTGSGTPYTRYSAPVAIGGRSNIAGSLNGSIKPWQFRSNLRVDKNIELTWGKKEGDDRKTANLNIYVQVLNLFNTRNVMNVYAFSGNPDDDGYLASTGGQQTIQTINNTLYQSSLAYQDQYNIFINSPNNYSRPRTIRIGVQLDF